MGITILGCLAISVLSGILCFIVEKMDSIPIHINHHHDPMLAALTGAVTTFFASLILIMITNFTITF